MRAYFDYNAAGQLRPEARAALSAWAGAAGGNPSSMHAEGRRSRVAVEEARSMVAALAPGAQGRDVVFTSGATESNHTVVAAFARAFPGGLLVTSNVEHASLESAADCAAASGLRVLRLPALSDGSLDLGPLTAIGAAVREGQAVLASLALAGGETGAVLDVASLRAALPPGSFIHLDAAQAAGRVPVPFGDGVDLVSLSGHKLGGAPGVGALVASARSRAWLLPLLGGGPQEWGLRAGTPNVPGIVAMGAAAGAALGCLDAEAARLCALRERLWLALSGLGGIRRVSPAGGLPNTLTIAVAGARSETMIAALDLAGFAVSAGPACAAGSSEPSAAMKAIGLEEPWIGGVLRISSGWATTAAEVDALAAAMADVAAASREAA